MQPWQDLWLRADWRSSGSHLSLAQSGRLDLVAVVIQIATIGAFYLKAKMMTSMSKKMLQPQNRSRVSEAVGNHTIITAFYSQEKVMTLFKEAQIGPKKESRRQSWYAGLGLFTSVFLVSTNMALLFWYGGKLINREN